MQKGIKSRLVSHEILYALKENSSNYDYILDFNIKKYSFNPSDIKLIHNIVLGSMRFEIYSKEIINKYIKKKIECTSIHFTFKRSHTDNFFRFQRLCSD